MKENNNTKIVSRLMFRLLPIQAVLMAVGAVNGIVSGFFATNYVGVDAMTAVGLYGPVTLFLSALSITLVGGSAVLSGKYMGKNEQSRLQNVFSLNMAVSIIIGAVFAAVFILISTLDLTGFITSDPVVRPIFNRYLQGQAIGVFPLILGNQLPAYLMAENRTRRTTVASISYILSNVILNFLFVKTMHLEAFGLALASSIGLWVFLIIQAEFFITGRSHLRFTLSNLDWSDCLPMVKIGFHGATETLFLTLRGFIVNWLLTAYVGSVGVSAFAAANNLLSIFWAIPSGMQNVSRLMISISVGEEDRQTLTDIMRVMFRKYLPLQCAVSALLIIFAVPLTWIYFHDPAEPVYMMTVWGMRILPLCMPLSIICLHFVAYGQASGKEGLVHTMAALDGAITVSALSALLIPAIGMNGLYIANVLNGVISILVLLAYSCIRNRHIPQTMDELMVIPEDFGATADERMDITVRSLDEVVEIASKIQAFCTERGIDERRAYLAGLSMEEMAGNVVDHGFHKDDKPHTVDVRVVHKGDDVILRIKDDCVQFDPGVRREMASEDDITKNIGIRMVFKIAQDIQYQNILGLNVLTIRI